MNKKLRILAALSLFLFGSASTFGYTRPNDPTIKTKLTAKQYYVPQQKATEKPYKNAYWDN